MDILTILILYVEFLLIVSCFGCDLGHGKEEYKFLITTTVIIEAGQ